MGLYRQGPGSAAAASAGCKVKLAVDEWLWVRPTLWQIRVGCGGGGLARRGLRGVAGAAMAVGWVVTVVMASCMSREARAVAGGVGDGQG